jgi:hypothetical protein
MNRYSARKALRLLVLLAVFAVAGHAEAGSPLVQPPFIQPPLVQPSPGRSPLAPDPIDQSRGLSLRPVPSAPVPPPPTERLVPEQRVIVPGTNREVVIPPHYERQVTDQRWQVPPLTGYGSQGEIVHFPGGERPFGQSP